MNFISFSMILVFKVIPSSTTHRLVNPPSKGSMVSYTATMSSCGQGAEWQRSMIYLEEMDLKRLPRGLVVDLNIRCTIWQSHDSLQRVFLLEIHRSPKPHQSEDRLIGIY